MRSGLDPGQVARVGHERAGGERERAAALPEPCLRTAAELVPEAVRETRAK